MKARIQLQIVYEEAKFKAMLDIKKTTYLVYLDPKWNHNKGQLVIEEDPERKRSTYIYSANLTMAFKSQK